jgi:hypothetical protein
MALSTNFGGEFDYGNTGNTSSFATMLKLVEKKIESSLNEDCPTWSLFQDNSKIRIGGAGLTWPVKTKRTGGAGAIAENGKLPTAGNITAPRATETPKTIAGRIEMTWELLHQAKTDQEAFGSSLATYMECMEDEIKQSMNRQVIGHKVAGADGAPVSILNKTGVLMRLSADPGTGKAVTIDDGFAGQLYPGMLLRVSTTLAELAGTPADTWVVDEVTGANTFTIVDAADAGVADNDLVCVGDATFTSVEQEILGLSHIIDDADELHNIDPATFTSWKATVSDNGGVAINLTDERLDALFDAVKDKSGKRPDTWIAHSSACRQVKQLMVNDVRYEPQTFRGGYVRKTLVWNSGEQDVFIMADKHVPLEKAFVFRRDEIAVGWTIPFGWVDDVGSTKHRKTDELAYQLVYAGRLNLACMQRNAHAVLDDIKVNTTLLGFGA